MANEITQNIKVSATKGGATVTIDSRERFDMAGADMTQATQNIGTTAETLSLGDITGAPRQLAIKNLDATNFVEIGGDSGLTVFKLKIRPLDCAVFEPSSGTVYAKADTASCLVQFVAIEL
jgi:hypothetical protein